MRVFLDTNVLLDYYLLRQPFFQNASDIIVAHQTGKCICYVAVITPINLYYIARKLKGDADARTAIRLLLSTFGIIPINHSLLASALSLPIGDYEDAVQAKSASIFRLEGIVTRNKNDYKNTSLPIYTPDAFLTLT